MKIQLIHIQWEGLHTEFTPRAFKSEQAAGDYFEKEVTAKGFRKRNPRESWTRYVQAFQEWEESDAITYDKNDWEIAWWEIELEA